MAKGRPPSHGETAFDVPQRSNTMTKQFRRAALTTVILLVRLPIGFDGGQSSNAAAARRKLFRRGTARHRVVAPRAATPQVKRTC